MCIILFLLIRKVNERTQGQVSITGKILTAYNTAMLFVFYVSCHCYNLHLFITIEADFVT